MSMIFPDTFTRLSGTDIPIYISPNAPHWFVPNTAGDRLIQELREKDNTPGAAHTKNALEQLRTQQFLKLIPQRKPAPYSGRGDVLSLDRLTECWIHLTDHCNLSCRHCLFSCSPNTRKSLSFEEVEALYRSTEALGTETYYITGGEPLLHPDFERICRLLLSKETTRLAILTNGLLLPDHLEFLGTLPKDRLHFQISVDGLEENHDAMRGRGAFNRLLSIFNLLSEAGLNTSLAMAVHKGNVHQMADIVTLAGGFGIADVHYLWLFAAGKARDTSHVPMDELFANLVQAETAAEPLGITIDNLKSMEARVFSSPGIRHDLGNAGWESLAVGPDGSIYPTPALIGNRSACCGHIKEGIEQVWKQSDELSALRRLSVVMDEKCQASPLRYIIGGGDIDHSYYAGHDYIGHDPYLDLYEAIALHLIETAATPIADSEAFPGIRLQMGDRLTECSHAEGDVALTHSNCVLSLAGTRGTVGAFYAEAADAPNTDIKNPVCYEEELIHHIPESARVRSYGCGSPVQDADLGEGETLVDLGSGAGVECFIAAKITGARGKVYGVDMLDDMLERARKAKDEVGQRLGYRNVEFKKGYLESIPLDEATADVVISNCVVNLSEDKTKTFAEIFRILKPGGRAVISDVTTDAPFPASIQNDPTLRGECIGGAMVQSRLMAMLEATGFTNIRIIKRFFYREVQGYSFYSLTYQAVKPDTTRAAVLYPGPFAGVITDQGEVIPRGGILEAPWPSATHSDPSAFVLDGEGNITNQDAENSCACYQPVDKEKKNAQPSGATILSTGKKPSGCMRCGRPLTYLDMEREETCSFCGETAMANALCESGHFVCDLCHSEDALSVVKHLCLSTKETDTITLFDRIKKHPSVPLHGPEHHFIVPGVITAAYRNAGGAIGDEEILSAIRRGADIPGGTCAFWGGCGAALGTGIAFGVILKSTPVKATERQIIQKVTGQIITALGELEAARCCRRETLTAFKIAADLSQEILPIPLLADGTTHCFQFNINKECLKSGCPWYVEGKNGIKGEWLKVKG
ncbi:aldolase-type tim barrel [Desulfoluna spongiiphila]|nr:aldolase-type tim barrel [Desulfoluna spongiiphila]